MSARHVVFVNRYFHPDHSATSQLLSDLAFHLAGRGWTVEVVTSRQRYDDARARLPEQETVRGVVVRRVRTTTFGRLLLAGRAIDYLTFYGSAFFMLTRVLRKGSIVVAMTDPPMISFVAALAAMLRRAALVNWIQDLFPEVARALGLLARTGGVLRPLRDWSLRRASANIVLGERMAARVAAIANVDAHGRQTITVLHNWAFDGLEPVARASNRIRETWTPGDPFVAGYSGNLGRVHEFATITAAMAQLPDISFVIVGDGARALEVRRATERLPNVQFRPYQPRELLGETLSSADVHLVTLLPQLEGLVVPSKFYGVIAVGRPVIFVGDHHGEIATLLREYDCGISVENGNPAELARAIRRLASDRAEAEAMGERGKTLYETRFAPRIALRRWEHILEGVRT